MEEKIVVWEGNEFYKINIKGRNSNDTIISNIKTKLKDFYPLESKVLFLKTLQNNIIKDILPLLNKKTVSWITTIPPKFQVTPTFQKQIKKQRVLFSYIKQEIKILQSFNIKEHLDEILINAKTKNYKDSKKRNKVYLCYSTKDNFHKNEIKKYFKPLLFKDAIWCKDNIKAHEVKNEKIKQAISETKVAIFLVSTDFLASDFVMDKEVPAILKAVEKGHTFPLVIILKPCSFTDIPSLNKYQTVNPPTQEVSRMDENEKAALFVNLVRLTMEILDYGKE
ncbi:MAG: hypothetical protein ACPG5B_00125 [Chitinophagales bacterium]